MERAVIYSVGHSNVSLEDFLQLLLASGVRTLVDIRSAPYSKYAPQFNLDALRAASERSGISFVYLGAELGGRPRGSEFYDEKGYVRYARVSEAQFFLEGLDSLVGLGSATRTAVMCGEEDPGSCHRRLLVGRVLHERGIDMVHIRGDGRLEPDFSYGRKPQMALLARDADGDQEWKSTRSVLPGARQRISSAP